MSVDPDQLGPPKIGTILHAKDSSTTVNPTAAAFMYSGLFPTLVGLV